MTDEPLSERQELTDRISATLVGHSFEVIGDALATVIGGLEYYADGGDMILQIMTRAYADYLYRGEQIDDEDADDAAPAVD